MDKNTNIMELYFKLSNNGAKGNFRRELSKLCGRSSNTIKNHWIHSHEVPEEFQDIAIKLLQAIHLQNNETVS